MKKLVFLGVVPQTPGNTQCHLVLLMISFSTLNCVSSHQSGTGPKGQWALVVLSRYEVRMRPRGGWAGGLPAEHFLAELILGVFVCLFSLIWG